MVTIRSRQITRFSMAAKVYAETLINQLNINLKPIYLSRG